MAFNHVVVGSIPIDGEIYLLRERELHRLKSMVGVPPTLGPHASTSKPFDVPLLSHTHAHIIQTHTFSIKHTHLLLSIKPS